MSSSGFYICVHLHTHVHPSPYRSHQNEQFHILGKIPLLPRNTWVMMSSKKKKKSQFAKCIKFLADKWTDIKYPLKYIIQF